MQPLLEALAARGVERTFVTLHVGAGTFQPVRTRDAGTRIACTASATRSARQPAAAIARRAPRGGRVVAVGTTVVRALESAALAGGGRARAVAGETRTVHHAGISLSGDRRAC